MKILERRMALNARRGLAVGVALLGLAALQGPAAAQNEHAPAPSGFRILLSQGDDSGLTRNERKIGPAIRLMLEELRARGITRANARTRNVAALSHPLVRLDRDGSIHVYLEMKDQSAPALDELRGRGARIDIVNRELGLVEAWIPFDLVEDVAAFENVTQLKRPSYAVTRAGSVTTESDSILNADQLRAGLSVDGTGVKVGVLSAGALSIADSQSSGDLPGTVRTFGTCDLSVWGPLFCDEGTAMLEIVHDIAPGAKLGIGAVATTLQFISRLDKLINTYSADVVVDDIGFPGEPYFEDGAVAKAANKAGRDVVVVSAAGNSALDHYEKNFKGATFFGGALPSLSTVHDFGRAAGQTSDTTMNLRFQPGGIMVVFLQWSDKFGKSANDYDLYLVDSTENTVLAQSTTIQNGNDDPFEAIGAQWPGSSPITVKLVIRKRQANNRRLEMFFSRSGVAIKQYGVKDGSIVGHPAAKRVLAVGAISAQDPGNDSLQSFSSRGNSRIFFPKAVVRNKPDVTGIDTVTTTGPGVFPVTFEGTSAAAPHVAGVAALLLEVAPTATPGQVRRALRNSAEGLGPAGRDKKFGKGLVDALAAGALIQTF